MAPSLTGTPMQRPTALYQAASRTLQCPAASMSRLLGFRSRCTTSVGLCSCKYRRPCAQSSAKRPAMLKGSKRPARFSAGTVVVGWTDGKRG